MSELKEGFEIDPMAVDFAKEVAKAAVDLEGKNVQSVKLFGSHAIGKSALQSDIDVMVVMDQVDQPAKAIKKIRTSLEQNDVAHEGLHILVVSNDEFQNPDTSTVNGRVIIDARDRGLIDIYKKSQIQ